MIAAPADSAAPGPLEDFALEFDAVFATPAQRRSWRTILSGLLAPRDRNKTPTALAGAEPIVQAQAAEVQRLQYFLSEADWCVEELTAQRLALLQHQAATAAHAAGVLVLDDTGDRKDGNATAHVGRQYLGSLGKVDNGIVAVTTLWTDGRLYDPLHTAPCTPAKRLARGKAEAEFRTKPQMAVELIEQARAAGIPYRAVVADCFHGDNDGLVSHPRARRWPFVVAHRGSVGRGWAPEDMAHSFEEALHDTRLSAGHKIRRRFSDGHQETWWAVEPQFPGHGPTRACRALCVTTDRIKRPAQGTWYLTTNLKQASLEEIAAIHAMRHWVEQGYKQMKDELGWADFQVRSDRAIRRHWELVCCAFAFCWWYAAREQLLAPPAQPTHHSTVRPATAASRRPGEKIISPQVALQLAADAAARARVADSLAPAGTAVGR
jgi:SRSO17 transposase